MDPDCVESFNISKEDTATMTYEAGHVFYITAFLPLLLVIGLLDNLAFIYVVIKIPRMRTCTNCYLLNLAISDILFLLMAIGEKIWRYAMSPIRDDDNPMGRGGCIWVFLLSDAAYIASLFFITLVSAERYCAVCRPQKKSESSQFTKTVIFTAGSWIISAIVAAALTPSNFIFNRYCLEWPPEEQFVNFPTTFAICHPLHDWVAAYALGMQTIPFFISLIVNTVLYIAIIRGLNRSIERLRVHGGTKDNDTKMRDQVARMLVINGAFFFCSLAPFEIVSALKMIARMVGFDYIGTATAQEVLSYLGRSLSYINAVINPIIYTVMSNRYRDAFKQAFHIGTSNSSKRLVSGKSTTQATTQEYLKVSQDTQM